MRILLLLERIPLVSECAPSSVDDEWLRALANTHDVVVAVDENTSGASSARDAGITVHVSDKRHVHMPDGEEVDADSALANWVKEQHRAAPFDLVVASSERPPFGAVRDAVPGTPWATLATSGPTAMAGRLQLDGGWLEVHGLELWRAASHLRAADLVVSPVNPGLLGLDVGSRPVAALLPPPDPLLVDRVSGSLVVIVATSVSTADATATIETALEAVTLHDETTVVVLYRPPLLHAENVLPGLTAALPDDIATRTIFVPVGRHEDAGAWLDASDALVLRSAGDLAVPAVARRSEVVPTVLINTASDWKTPQLVAPPVLEERGAVELLAWTNPTSVAEELRTRRRRPSPESVVLHTAAATPEAVRWRRMRDIERFDVVVGALPRPPWSNPRLGMLAVDVVCLHRRAWNAAADALDSGLDLPELISRLVDPSGVLSHTLGAVAVEHEPPTTVRPRRVHSPVPLLGGPLPSARPRAAPPPLPPPPAPPPAALVPTPEPEPEPEPEPTPEEHLRSWAKESSWPTRRPIGMPWRLGLRQAIERGELPDGVAAWAKEHTISDRARLLLPWRWGLLPKAMEDRW